MVNGVMVELMCHFPSDVEPFVAAFLREEGKRVGMYVEKLVDAVVDRMFPWTINSTCFALCVKLFDI